MTSSGPFLIPRHLIRMRVTAVAFLVAQPVAAVLAYLLTRHRLSTLPPLAVTGLMLVWGLWLALTADRMAQGRLLRAKEAFVVHGDEGLLLRDHFRVFVTVLLRLGGLTLAGLATAVWGVGPRTALWFFVAASILGALAWPTEGKTLLLLRRARDLRTRENA